VEDELAVLGSVERAASTVAISQFFVPKFPIHDIARVLRYGIESYDHGPLPMETNVTYFYPSDWHAD
jgi:hypothetical protein